MKRKPQIASLGARLGLIAGLLAGYFGFNSLNLADGLLSLAGSILISVISAWVGFLIGHKLFPSVREEADKIEETFE